MLYMLNEESIEMLRRELSKPGAVVKSRDDGMYAVHPGTGWPDWAKERSRLTANDALTLSAAHRLISKLAETTNSRAELDECRDVMSQLERMVEEG